MSTKLPLTCAISALAVLGTACSAVSPVPADKHPIHSTVAMEAQGAKCHEAGLIDDSLYAQIQSNADVVRLGINISQKNYSKRLEQAMQSTTVTPATCQQVADVASDLKLAAEYFAIYPRDQWMSNDPNGVVTNVPTGEAVNMQSYGNQGALSRW